MVNDDIKKEQKVLQKFTGTGSFFVILSKPVLELAMGWKKDDALEIEYDISKRQVIIHEAPAAEAQQS